MDRGRSQVWIARFGSGQFSELGMEPLDHQQVICSCNGQGICQEALKAQQGCLDRATGVHSGFRELMSCLSFRGLRCSVNSTSSSSDERLFHGTHARVLESTASLINDKKATTLPYTPSPLCGCKPTEGRMVVILRLTPKALTCNQTQTTPCRLHTLVHQQTICDLRYERQTEQRFIVMFTVARQKTNQVQTKCNKTESSTTDHI